jgi:pSer/pThr/pTyr-binding forkhead associated (FHA) protein
MPKIVKSDKAPQIAKLGWTDKGGAAKEYILQEGTSISLGRDKKNEVVLFDRKVSRRHTKIAWSDNNYSIIDLGSSNGTFLNGEQITDPTPLKNGDQIMICTQILSFTIPPIDKMDTKVFEGAEPEPGEASIEHRQTMLYEDSDVEEELESAGLLLEQAEIEKEAGGMAEALKALDDQLRAAQAAVKTFGNTGRETRSRLESLAGQLETAASDADSLGQKAAKAKLMDLLEKLTANPNDVTLLTDLAQHTEMISGLVKGFAAQASVLGEIKQALDAELLQLPS